jgi:serine/threonine protein kinase
MVPKVVIGDFGISIELKHPTELTFENCGTLCYMAPEVLQMPNRGYSFEADTFSLGSMLYEMCASRKLIRGSYSEIVKMTIGLKKVDVEQIIKSLEYINTSKCLDLMRRLLDPNPMERISIDDAIDHPWFNMFRDQNPTSHKKPPLPKFKISRSLELLNQSSQLIFNEFKVSKTKLVKQVEEIKNPLDFKGF